MGICGEELGDEWDDGVAVLSSLFSVLCSVFWRSQKPHFSQNRGEMGHRFAPGLCSLLGNPHFWQNRPEVGHPSLPDSFCRQALFS